MSRVTTLTKVCLILLIAQLVSCDWYPNNAKQETLCNTAECKTRGEEYKKNLNAKAHPCQDFYTFTCGNWQKNHPGPKYTASWDLVDIMNLDFLEIIRKTLESYNFQSGDDPLFQHAKMVYETCIKIPEYPIKDAKDVAQEVMKIGHVPKTPLWDIHTKYLQLSGESAFFRTKVLGSKTPNAIPTLMIMEPVSAYGLIFHEETWKPQEKKAYTDFLFSIMKSLRSTGSDAQIRDQIEKVFQFRKKLNRIIAQNKKTKPDSFRPYVGVALDKWFLETIDHQTDTQDIPWIAVIDTLMQNVPSKQRQTRKIIAMRQKEYFLDLMDLLKETPQEVLASHMKIYFVERHMKLNNEQYKLLEGTSVEPHNLKVYIREKHTQRWQTCIEDLNLKEALEKLLYQKWFPKYHAVIVREMISRIMAVFKDQMEKSNWLDKPTREETTKRLNKIVEWVGFPHWINGTGSVTVPRNPKDILTPEASLTLTLNLLYIHAPLLIPPIFSPTIPSIYNYAGMGTTVGHELYHIIDDCGKYVLDTGNEVWWSSEMRTKCLKKKALFIRAYDLVTDRDFKTRYNMVVKSDTSCSFLENYPDVMGLEAAYIVYKRLANTDKTVCQTLPNFEKYSCDQMFYIAFANTYCGYNTKKAAEMDLAKKSMHSLDSIRINGAVSQMTSFATAFGCPAGSPMNPETKANLWQ